MTIVPNLIDRILSLVPDAIVTVKNDDYDTIEWHPSNTDPQPTLAEVQAVDEFVEVRERLKEQIEDKAEKENSKKLKRFRQPIQLVRAIGILNKKIDGIALTAGEQNLLDQLTNDVKPALDIVDANVEDLKNQVDAAADPNTVDVDTGWP